MKKYIGMLLVVCLTASAAWTHETSDDLVFAVMGDGPYAGGEWEMLEKQIAAVNRAKPIRFLTHIGDIWHGSPSLPGRHYTRVANLLKTSRKPVFIIPGDNEWNDLDDPAIGWGHWEREFMKFEENFSKVPKTIHQNVRPENFAFVTDHVLFIGINLVGGRVHDQEEWNKRFKDNIAWIKSQFDDRGGSVRAAVILSHARPAAKHDAFFNEFTRLVKRFKKPVLYLHGDGHNFDIQAPWRELNLWRVQIDSIGKNPPLEVRVTRDIGEPFCFNRYSLKK